MFERDWMFFHQTFTNQDVKTLSMGKYTSVEGMENRPPKGTSDICNIEIL